MAAVGGSIESISIRGRNFPVTADADASRKLGGFESEMQANGDGTVRIIKTRVPWLLDGIVVEIDDARADQEFLQEIADGNDAVPITITYASGVIYQATGKVNGEIKMQAQNTTATIALGGGGKMEQQ
jgi:hypothetical protein